MEEKFERFYSLVEDMKNKKKCKERKLEYVINMDNVSDDTIELFDDVFSELYEVNSQLRYLTPSFYDGESNTIKFIFKGKIFTLKQASFIEKDGAIIYEPFLMNHRLTFIDIDKYMENNNLLFAYDVEKKRVINLWTGKPSIVIDEE